MKLIKFIINLPLAEMIIYAIIALLIIFLYGCTNTQSKQSFLAQESFETPENYEIMVVKSPKFKKWIVRDRKLIKKIKYRY